MLWQSKLGMWRAYEPCHWRNWHLCQASGSHGVNAFASSTEAQCHQPCTSRLSGLPLCNPSYATEHLTSSSALLCRLYNTSYKTPSQLYMLLIIILILSQDKGFSQNVQEVMLGSVPWYKERMLQKTSLGNLSLCLSTCCNWLLHTCSNTPFSLECFLCATTQRKQSIRPCYAGCDLHAILPTKHVPVAHERRQASS